MRQDHMPDNPFEKIAPELWLMLAGAGGDTAKIQNLLQQPVNWDLLLQLAVYHRVYPLVHKTLSQLNNPAVPEHVLGFLRQKYQANAMQALNMTGEMVRIIKCFESHGIHAVVLKGAPLAWRLYGDIAIRPSKDIDILVPTDELEKTHAILENEGYHRKDPEYILTSRELQIYLKHNHHFDYWHRKKRINLEIHWKLGHDDQEIPLPTESNTKRIEVAGSLIPVIPNEEWLLYLMFHGAKHAWFRLRWLVDIAKFAQREDIDWKKTVFLAKSFGIQPILHQALVLANRLLAAPVPSNFLSVLEHDRSAWRLSCIAINQCMAKANYEIRGPNNQYSWPYYLQKSYDFHLRAGWKDKFNYVFSLKKDDIEFISLPDRLYALYYVIRPFAGLRRYLRKLRAGN